jgi:hypothetical protein
LFLLLMLGTLWLGVSLYNFNKTWVYFSSSVPSLSITAFSSINVPFFCYLLFSLSLSY